MILKYRWAPSKDRFELAQWVYWACWMRQHIEQCQWWINGRREAEDKRAGWEHTHLIRVLWKCCLTLTHWINSRGDIFRIDWMCLMTHFPVWWQFCSPKPTHNNIIIRSILVGYYNEHGCRLYKNGSIVDFDEHFISRRAFNYLGSMRM